MQQPLAVAFQPISIAVDALQRGKHYVWRRGQLSRCLRCQLIT